MGQVANKQERDADSSDWQAEFSRIRPLYLRFTSRLEGLIKELLEAKAVQYHLIESRTKSETSFRDKATRASKNYSQPLQEIDDISGVRIITFYQDHADAVGALIESEFVVMSSDRSAASSDPSAFGYRSAHYVVGLHTGRADLLEWAGLGSLKAEIQVRTVLQHAWAAISHKLQYKREADVPKELRRKLFRLSALFELADDEFISLRNASGLLAQSIGSKLSAGDTTILVDRISMRQFLDQAAVVAEIVADAAEVGFSVENSESFDRGEVDSISDLLKVLNIAGVATIAEFDVLLTKFSQRARGYLEKLFLVDGGGKWTVSAAFICLLVVIGALRDTIRVGHLLQLGWSRPIAQRVVTTARKFNGGGL